MLKPLWLIIAVLMTLAPAAFARDLNLNIKFGPEFTFNAGEERHDARERVVKRQRNHLIDNQPEGAKFEWENNRFVSPNGWWFMMNTDPGVIEVQMKPATWWEFENYQADMQDAIFVSAANEGYFPGLFAGGGHINIGISEIIDASPLLMRNFLADLINHSELFMGVFGYDTNNALPFPLFAFDVQERMLALIDGFDRGHVNLQSLIKDMDKIQQGQTDLFGCVWHRTTNCIRGKMTAFSMLNVSANGLTGHMELRGVRPQASMDVWVRQTRLLYKRLMYLRNLNRPIPVKPLVHVVEPLDVTFEAHVLNPPVNPQEALKAFHTYVSEAGERWADHKDYLWPKWISDGEVERYEKSHLYKKVVAKSCAKKLMAALTP